MKDKIAFIEEVKAQRQKEVAGGENLHTAYPLYVVYSIRKSYADEYTDCQISTTLNDHEEYEDFTAWIKKDDGEVYFEDEKEYKKYLEDKENNVTEEDFKVMLGGCHDVFMTCCFTREAAEAFIRAERHNMDMPYVHVRCIPYRNQQLMRLVEVFGDKKF